MNIQPIRPYLEPICKSVSVNRTPAEAFEIFTGRIGSWWPIHAYSISQERAVSCAIEPHVGGAIFELRDDGARFAWGRVLAWEPPARFVMAWHPGREPETAQEVEVRFVAQTDGTRVELEHRGWEKLGDHAAAAREGYQSGWNTVLGKQFVEACARVD